MSDPWRFLARFAERLSLLLIAALMFLVSRGVDLVVAVCGHGVTLPVRTPTAELP